MLTMRTTKDGMRPPSLVFYLHWHNRSFNIWKPTLHSTTSSLMHFGSGKLSESIGCHELCRAVVQHDGLGLMLF